MMILLFFLHIFVLFFTVEKFSFFSLHFVHVNRCQFENKFVNKFCLKNYEIENFKINENMKNIECFAQIL